MKQFYDPELALRQTIAGILDKPSVYMGGPSRQNLKRADEIIAALRRDGQLLGQLCSPAEGSVSPQTCSTPGKTGVSTGEKP